MEMSSGKTSTDARLFFEYLRKQHPDFPEKKIRKELVAKKLFSKDPKPVKKVENTMYKFWALLEDFLIYKELLKHKKERSFLLLQALKSRNLDKYFFKNIEEIEKEWERSPPAGIEHLHDVYRLKKMHLEHPQYLKEEKRILEPQDLVNHVEQYYLAIKLQMTLSDHYTRKFLVDTSKEESLYQIEPLVDFINRRTERNVPQVQLMAELFNATQKKDSKVSSHLKDHFITHFDLFKDDEQIDFLTFLSHIYYEHYREGAPEALQALFELNRFTVEKKLVVSDGHIVHDLFLNIVNIACSSGQWKWARDFVQDHQAFLQKEYKEDVAILAMAIIYFSEGDYEKVLSRLAQLRFQHVFFALQGRALKLQAFYEMEEYEELFFDLCKSFKLFLYRNGSIANNMQTAFGNFIGFAKKLQKIKNEYGADKRKLKSEIKECKDIVYKSWLMQKVELLKK